MRNDNKKDVTRNKKRDNKKTGREGTRKNAYTERANRENLTRQKLTSQVLAQEARKNQDGQNQRELPEDVLIGRNAVTEALRAGRGINKILLADGDREGQVSEITALAKERGIILQFVERSKIESIAGGLRHQGVLAYVAPVAYAELEDILAKAEAAGEPPFLLLLDELEDPHNLGALLRTADATGVHGVLIPKRRSVPLTATVAKTSAGAVEYVPVARIGNISQTLKALKEKGFWVAGADMDGSQNYYEADLTGPLVLVVGSEGKGMGRLTKEQCDFIVKMPMVGKINSLNASVAGSILMYESMRQRLAKKN
ncbi:MULTISPECIES: 23S rRNA (guanosine(2251)-2'-O)-methyltransferase RlmB [Selenomonas]|uniref:23S rRNA (Guanosine2251-2'-O)-methyltransferase n=1 Tax=Selenomonas ruminantium TaxID=971 RepID=A0A1H3VP58_SELRU|nr:MULTISPECIES: 23S rRNA (guanosine(2251)-2'-O)-methyltransferase RlmB [Selenomonas]SDZ75908.1 23S rRNA (guanosine2251-2'-O)-methyltransferase [Selenomonas ruminantium]